MTDRERLEHIEVEILGIISKHERDAEFWKNRDVRQYEFHKGRILELKKVLKIVKEDGKCQ